MSQPSHGDKPVVGLPELAAARKQNDLSHLELPNRLSIYLASWQFYDRPLFGVTEYLPDLLEKVVPEKTGCHKQHPIGSKRGELQSHLLLHGRDLAGQGISVNVIGFMPWAVLEWPSKWNQETDLNAFRLHLQRLLLNDQGDEVSPMIQVQTALRQPLMGFSQTPRNVIVVYFATEWMRRKFRYTCNGQRYRGVELQVCESEVDPGTQFLIASGVKAMQWFSLPVSRLEPPTIWLTHSPREYQLLLRGTARLEPLGGHFEPRTDIPRLGQLVMLSFDTEFKGTGTHFPQVGHVEDECFAICASVSLLGSDKILHRAAFTFDLHGSLPPEQGEAKLPKVFRQALAELTASNVGSERYPIARPNVLYNEATQIEMFRAFRNYIIAVDPDILTGYNIEGFDCKYMDHMVQALNQRSGQTERCTFNYISKVIDEKCPFVEKAFDNAGAGQNDRGAWKVESRAVFDPYFWFKTNHKLKKYSLDDISLAYLKVNKVQVKYSEINAWRESRDALLQTKGLIYCTRDADLPIYLIEKFQMLVTQIMLGQLTSTSLQKVVTCGQQAKIYNQISVALYTIKVKHEDKELRYFNNVVPAGKKKEQHQHQQQQHSHPHKRKHREEEEEEEDAEDGEEEAEEGAEEDIVPDKYQGATVFEPVKGLHRWVGCLDFQSLYPSIMRAHNICPSTLVLCRATHPAEIPLNTAHISDTKQHLFVKSEVRKGLIPEILRSLLDGREAVKQEIKALKKTPNPDPQLLANLDGRQLACKLAANSIYGFFGARVGRMYLPSIAESVTCFGRDAIFKTKEIVEHSIHGADKTKLVVYGDTDSVFIKISGDSLAGKSKVELLQELIELMVKFAKEVTQYFRDNGYSDVKLVFEKIFSTLVLIQKKKYMGEACEGTTPDTWKIMIKGLKAVRRDVPPFISDANEAAYTEIVVNSSPDAALRVVMDTLVKLAEDRFEVADYETSRSMKRTYKGALPGHALLNQKKAEREPGTEAKPGDRIDFVIVTGKNLPQKVSERLEDPAYFEQHRKELSIDRVHYLHLFEPEILQVFDCLSRDLRPLIATCKSILVNQHCRQTSINSLFRPKEARTEQEQEQDANRSLAAQALWKTFSLSGLGRPVTPEAATDTVVSLGKALGTASSKTSAVSSLFGQAAKKTKFGPVSSSSRKSSSSSSSSSSSPPSTTTGRATRGIMSMFRSRLPDE